MAPTSLLLATDLSSRCDRAVDRATALATEWSSHLVVVHALSEPAPVTDAPSWRRSPDLRQEVAQRIRADLRGATGVDLTVVVERGEPASLVLETAGRLGCELIVTGTPREETLSRALLGTTIEALARRADVPVLVVKSRPQGTYRNLVVATDFSEGSRQALQTALALFPGAQLSLFHAYDVIYEGFITDKMAARTQLRQQAMEQAHAFLATTPAVAASGRQVAVLCEYGEPGALLAELVQARGKDLVVLGTEGRSGLASVLLGSVAQRMLSRLPDDTLVVRRKKG